MIVLHFFSKAFGEHRSHRHSVSFRVFISGASSASTMLAQYIHNFNLPMGKNCLNVSGIGRLSVDRGVPRLHVFEL